jgi:hypothetical protein
MTDLAIRHLGPELRSPLVASAGPLAGEIETLVASEVARAVTVGLPSPFEEEPGRDKQRRGSRVRRELHLESVDPSCLAAVEARSCQNES